MSAPKNDVKSLIASDSMQRQFALALPKHLSPERFGRVAITALTRTPKLAECTRESLMKCLLDLSAMGLEPDGRRAHLIPFENRKSNTVECTLIVDYKGIVELALRSGTIASIHCDRVCDRDDFAVNRGVIVRHVVNYREERGLPYCYYALITFKDGGEKAEVMTIAEVNAIRDNSQGYKAALKYNKDHPWTTNYDEMAKKTVFRRASKWITLSPEIRDALASEDDSEERMRNVTPPPRMIEDSAPTMRHPLDTPTDEPEPAAESEPETLM